MITYVLAMALWAHVWRAVVVECGAAPIRATTSPPDSPIVAVTLRGSTAALACADLRIEEAAR